MPFAFDEYFPSEYNLLKDAKDNVVERIDKIARDLEVGGSSASHLLIVF
jgi:hypothetical protein